jgi:predicted amidophosphoribosyltransferase
VWHPDPGGRRGLLSSVSALAQAVAPRECVGCARPGIDLCPACHALLDCRATGADPDPRPADLPPTFAATGYDGVARAAILAFKEEGRSALLAPLADALVAAVAAFLVRAPLPTGPVVLVPVPSSPQASRARVTDPTDELARSAAARLHAAGLDVGRTRALRSARRRADQAGLPAAARHANLHAALIWRGRPPAGSVVVIDAIVTTGATFAEAARATAAGGGTVLGCAAVAATVRRR